MATARAYQQHRRVALLLLLIGALVALFAFEPVRVALERILEASKDFIGHHEVLGVGLFVVLSAISAIAFFFSTAVIIPVAVYAWGKPTTMLLLWGSWMLGAVISYTIGRLPGRRLAKWFVSSRRVARYEKKLSARASFPLVLLFQLAVPSEIPGYVLGALRYHFGRYLAARAIAEVPFAVGAVYLGDSFVRQEYILLVAIAVAGVVLSALALHQLHQRMERA
jgi:uncharacterized membrane protein YdjX (TVP38/TMEM64 family)